MKSGTWPIRSRPRSWPYDYLLADSVTVVAGGRRLRVYAVSVRPALVP